MIAQAGHRHRDLVCRIGWHARQVRYPRAVWLDEKGHFCLADVTYCGTCERLLVARPAALGVPMDKAHQLAPRGISPRVG